MDIETFKAHNLIIDEALIEALMILGLYKKCDNPNIDDVVTILSRLHDYIKEQMQITDGNCVIT